MVGIIETGSSSWVPGVGGVVTGALGFTGGTAKKLAEARDGDGCKQCERN